MADMRTLEVEADVSESQLSKTRVGQPVEVMLDALPNERFRAVVGGVVPTVDRAKATVVTKIRFEKIDPRILPEMSAKVNFLSREVSVQEQQPVMAVNPQVWPSPTAVAAKVQVWKLVPTADKQWQVQPVEVTVGRRLGDVQTLVPTSPAALKAGDQLVLMPDGRLRAGQSVTLAKP
jgi:hypothetical protein